MDHTAFRSAMDEPQSRNNSRRQRVRIGLVFLMVGVVVFIIGTEPERFGLDRSPVTGFVQISVFLVGLAMICMGGYISLNALWNGRQKTIAADIGLRLVSTGYVISFASGWPISSALEARSTPTFPILARQADWGDVWGSDDHHRLRVDDPILQSQPIKRGLQANPIAASISSLVLSFNSSSPCRSASACSNASKALDVVFGDYRLAGFVKQLAQPGQHTIFVIRRRQPL